MSAHPKSVIIVGLITLSGTGGYNRNLHGSRSRRIERDNHACHGRGFRRKPVCLGKMIPLPVAGFYDTHLHVGSVGENSSIAHVSIMKTKKPAPQDFFPAVLNMG
jgi:hypothetical protein